MKDKLKVDRDELESLVARKIKDCDLASLTNKRAKVMDYYNCLLPKQQRPGQASFVSPDVRSNVNWSKSAMSELFSNRDILSFSPRNGKDVEPARIATEYTLWTLNSANDGWAIKRDLIFDAHMGPFAIAKAYWSDEREEEDKSFTGLATEEVELIASLPEVASLEAELDAMDGSFSGKFTRVVSDTSQVRIEVVAPEEFGIDPAAKSVKDAFHSQRVLKTKAEMKAMGLDVKLLDDAALSGDGDITDIEANARLSRLDGAASAWSRDTDAQSPLTRQYWVYECYVYVTAKNGSDVLYKVIRVGSTTLDVQEVNRSPFILISILPRPHTVFGEIFAENLIPIQNARTILNRAILDQTAVASNPRWMVHAGQVPNPRELLDNRLGGIVNVTTPNAVMPLAQPTLNTFVFNTDAAMKAAGEVSSGISSLAMGQSKEALSNQNSTQLVSDQIDVSQTSHRVMAHNFASGLAELFVEVYSLILENDKRIQKNAIEIAGSWVDIDPKAWIERKSASIDQHLAKGDAEAKGMKLTGIIGQLGQDPAARKMIGEKGLFNAAVDVLRFMGFKNASAYITDPSQIPPTPPDPMALKQLELQERQIAAQEMAVQVSMLKVHGELEVKHLKVQLDEMMAMMKGMKDKADGDRKDMDTAARIENNHRELDLLEQAQNAAPAEVRGIISPT